MTVALSDRSHATTVLDACAVVITEPLTFGRRADEAEAQDLGAALQRTARALAELDGQNALPG